MWSQKFGGANQTGSTENQAEPSFGQLSYVQVGGRTEYDQRRIRKLAFMREGQPRKCHGLVLCASKVDVHLPSLRIHAKEKIGTGIPELLVSEDGIKL